jgi:hypothetical protein
LGSKWGTLTIVFLAIFEGDEGMLNRIWPSRCELFELYKIYYSTWPFTHYPYVGRFYFFFFPFFLFFPSGGRTKWATLITFFWSFFYDYLKFCS